MKWSLLGEKRKWKGKELKTIVYVLTSNPTLEMVSNLLLFAFQFMMATNPSTPEHEHPYAAFNDCRQKENQSVEDFAAEIQQKFRLMRLHQASFEGVDTQDFSQTLLADCFIQGLSDVEMKRTMKNWFFSFPSTRRPGLGEAKDKAAELERAMNDAIPDFDTE